MIDNDIQDKFDEVNKELADLALVENTNKNNINNIKESIGKLEIKVDDLAKEISTNKDEIVAAVKAEFVKYVEFEPVKSIVYGLVTWVLISVLIAVLALVIVPVVSSYHSLGSATPVPIVKEHGE